MKTISIYSVNDDDANAQNVAHRLYAKVLDTTVTALFNPGEVLLQSQSKPNAAPDWAWGFTVTRKNPPIERCWYDPSHPFIDEFYSGGHETGHAFMRIFGSPEMQDAVMKLMVGIEEDQGWGEGVYTNKRCTVPAEGFADSFIKAQDSLNNQGRLSAVLPRFYVPHVPPENYPQLLTTIVQLAKRKV